MSFDPVDPGVDLPPHLSGGEEKLEPFGWYAEMRKEAPLAYDETRQCWDVFAYDAVESVLTDHETFSSSIIGEGIVFKDTLLGMDPPEHTRVRSAVESYFQPGEVRRMESGIRQDAERLLDESMGDSGGTIDVVEAIAYPLPINTIADLLGIPDDMRETFKTWSDDVIAGPQMTGGDWTEMVRTRGNAVRDIGNFFNETIQRKKEDPGDDLISNILQSDADLTQYELLRLCGLVLVAGNVTTTNLITNAVWCLSRRPEVLEQLGPEDETIDTTIEEVLRYRSPVQQTVRRATRDVEVEGKQIRKCDSVVAWLGSANRDPAVFEDPERFRPHRNPNPHVAFGRGAHLCLGAHLARLEARLALVELVSRVIELELVQKEFEPVSATFLHGVQQLQVRYET